jgi:hypothetical protein
VAIRNLLVGMQGHGALADGACAISTHKVARFAFHTLGASIVARSAMIVSSESCETV